MKYLKCLIIFIFTLILMAPILWMFIGSLQDLRGLMVMPPKIIPENMSLMNYKNLLLEEPGLAPTVPKDGIDTRTPRWFGTWIANTTVIIAIKFLIVVITSAMVGYVFAVYNFKHKNAIFIVFIARIVLPPTLLIPTFIAVQAIGLYDSWWGIILPGSYSAVCMYLMKNQIDTIPRELVDSARIDGAGEARILTDVILPLCKPTIGVIGVMVAMGTLQDYIWTTLILPSKEKWTLVVGIMSMLHKSESIQSSINPLGIRLAGGCILFIPLFLIFAFFQRYFVEGLQIGAIKA